MEPDPDPPDQYQAGRATQCAPNENTGDRSVTSKVDSGQNTSNRVPREVASMVSGCGHSTLGTDKTSTTSTDRSRAQHDHLTRGKLTSEPQLPDFASAKSTSSGRRAPTTRQAPQDTLPTQAEFQDDINDQIAFPPPNSPGNLSVKQAAKDTPQTMQPTQHKQRSQQNQPTPKTAPFDNTTDEQEQTQEQLMRMHESQAPTKPPGLPPMPSQPRSAMPAAAAHAPPPNVSMFTTKQEQEQLDNNIATKAECDYYFADPGRMTVSPSEQMYYDQHEAQSNLSDRPSRDKAEAESASSLQGISPSQRVYGTSGPNLDRPVSARNSGSGEHARGRGPSPSSTASVHEHAPPPRDQSDTSVSDDKTNASARMTPQDYIDLERHSVKVYKLAIEHRDKQPYLPMIFAIDMAYAELREQPPHWFPSVIQPHAKTSANAAPPQAQQAASPRFSFPHTYDDEDKHAARENERDARDMRTRAGLQQLTMAMRKEAARQSAAKYHKTKAEGSQDDMGAWSKQIAETPRINPGDYAGPLFSAAAPIPAKIVAHEPKAMQDTPPTNPPATPLLPTQSDVLPTIAPQAPDAATAVLESLRMELAASKQQAEIAAQRQDKIIEAMAAQSIRAQELAIQTQAQLTAIVQQSH